MYCKGIGLFYSTVFYSITTALTAKVSNVVTGAYVVEFTDDYDTNSFMKASESVNAIVRRRLEYKLFKGVSIQLNNETDIETAVSNIEDMTKVKNVWPVRTIQMPNNTVIWTGNDFNAAGSALNNRQSTNTINNPLPHVMTQVDRLHAKGVTGKGAKIAVLDSGIDYMHPALGGCFGPGCLVAYGANFAGDDSEPLDCNGHGTHVAGIIAAQKNKYGFTGAAPDVTLGNYRIAGCNGLIPTDSLIAAFNQAYEDGSDIITSSIGDIFGFSDEPTSLALHRIVKAGVPCTVAASNAGNAGILFPSNPSSGVGVTAIASTENPEIRMLLLEGYYITGNSSVATFGWAAGTPDSWGNISLPLWANPYNTSDPSDSCKSLPSDTPDLSNYIVLIPADGDCFLWEKYADAAAHGARFIMVYADFPTIPTFGTDEEIDAIGAVTFEQGLEWQNLLSHNVNITINIVDPKSAITFISSERNVMGGFISRYSSWGPTYDLHLKPQFSAPGSYILSTYPVDKGGYAILSGTSMSTPLAAAIYALVGQVQGTFDPTTIESLLSSTAKPNLFHDGTTAQPFLAPTPQQGGGLIQAYNAAYSTTILIVSSLSFNDTDHLLTNAKFAIKNLGTTSKTYKISNSRAASVYATSKDNHNLPEWSLNEMTTEGASLSFSSEEVTVPAGGEAIVTVSPTVPALDTSRLPIYSGYIVLNATDGDSLSLPYVGVVGSLYKLDPLNRDPVTGTGVQDGTGNWITANQTFSFPKGEVDGAYYNPIPYVALAWQSSLVRVDVIPLDPNVNTTEVSGVQILDSVKDFPIQWQPRGAVYPSIWGGQLSDGNFAPEGGYRLLFRVLRAFGDPTKRDDYDSMESLPFFISYITKEAIKVIES